MRKLDREIVEIAEGAPLHVLNDQLRALQDILPQGSEARVTVQGDDNFGWRLVISYFRELTTEEAEMERKYASKFAHPNERFFAARPSRPGAELFSI